MCPEVDDIPIPWGRNLWWSLLSPLEPTDVLTGDVFKAHSSSPSTAPIRADEPLKHQEKVDLSEV